MSEPELQVQLTWNHNVGIGLMATTFIPKGTKVAYYYGNVWNTSKAKKEAGNKLSHFMTIPGTGCSIDGSFDVVLPNVTFPNFEEKHHVPCPLMSLTNSSTQYKPANCKLKVDEQDAREYSNHIWLDRTAWLITTKDIQPLEELIWKYKYIK